MCNGHMAGGSQCHALRGHGWTETSPAAAFPLLKRGRLAPRGVIFEPNVLSPTHHQAIVDFNGKSYILYHTAALPGGGEFRRSVSVEELAYNSDGTIKPLVQTSTGLDGVRRRLQSYNFPDRYIRHVNFVLKLEVPSGTTALQDATFWMVAP